MVGCNLIYIAVSTGFAHAHYMSRRIVMCGLMSTACFGIMAPGSNLGSAPMMHCSMDGLMADRSCCGECGGKPAGPFAADKLYTVT
jgi:hypothetical protein